MLSNVHLSSSKRQGITRSREGIGFYWQIGCKARFNGMNDNNVDGVVVAVVLLQAAAAAAPLASIDVDDLVKEENPIPLIITWPISNIPCPLLHPPQHKLHNNTNNNNNQHPQLHLYHTLLPLHNNNHNHHQHPTTTTTTMAINHHP